MMKVYVRLDHGIVKAVATEGEAGVGYHPIAITLPNGVMKDILMGFDLDGARAKAEEICQLHADSGIDVISDEEINDIYDTVAAESSGPGFNAVKFGRRVMRAHAQAKRRENDSSDSGS